MRNSSFLNFDDCKLSNDLWPYFINEIGINKAKSAVRQSLDLQTMQGNIYTVPVLLLETCGSALVSTQVIQSYIGLSCEGKGILLIYSRKLKSIQLIRDN